MAKRLEQASQCHKMYHHDLESNLRYIVLLSLVVLEPNV